ncbi:ABC transporter permease [[Clostridium] fimetarium]|uniref:Tungstate transport system permease protein n=1 Tax=[Clostridium] fimetarium TaxID=99656 RepID=A0A1I0RGS0_9FIRM|nr:ABC transporter permease [[Clostridium] fimetarium]SEW39459.1 tungstate transport system permease protein [[Clostridium] fimetarium]
MGFLQSIGFEINQEIFDIISLTIKLAVCSTFVSTLLGIPFGMLLEKTDFFGKGIIIRINRTLMGLPPVVAGLLVYLLLMRKGWFGSFNLLFTFEAMIIAQVVIITPIISGMSYTTSRNIAPQVRNFAKSMGANRRQTFFLLLKEMKNDLYFIIVTGFGRSISEVGAVMIVGGNIQYKTRTMTTAISLMRNRGDYSEAITLGVMLLLISFIIQCIVDILRRCEDKNENY